MFLEWFRSVQCLSGEPCREIASRGVGQGVEGVVSRRWVPKIVVEKSVSRAAEQGFAAPCEEHWITITIQAAQSGSLLQQSCPGVGKTLAVMVARITQLKREPP